MGRRDRREHRDLYGIDPTLVIPVHGTPQPLEEKLAGAAKQVETAQRFCTESAGQPSVRLPGALLDDWADRAVMVRRSLELAAAINLGFLVAGAAVAQPPAGDWPMYSHDYAGNGGFSPLTHIDRANVGALGEAW